MKNENIQFEDILVLDSWKIKLKKLDEGTAKSLSWIAEIIVKLCKIEPNWSSSDIEEK